MRIDCHSHILPRPYLELLRRHSQWPRTTFDGDVWSISYGNIQEFRVRESSYDINYKIEEMDRFGIDVSVLSTNIPGPELLSADLAGKGARILNEYLAEAAQAYPDRFVGLASLPWQSPELALAEIDYSIELLGLRGVVLYSHINGCSVDDPAFEAIYNRLAEREVPVVLHPTVPTWGGAIQDYSMVPMLGFQVDTSFALLRLILGGVLERNPSLKVVMPHAGGILPYMMGRIEHQTEVLGRGREHISRAPRSYFRQIYLDTVTPSIQTLRFAYEFLGSDRLLFGTDAPWVDVGLLIDLVESLDLSVSEADAVFCANAKGLFRL